MDQSTREFTTFSTAPANPIGTQRILIRSLLVCILLLGFCLPELVVAFPPTAAKQTAKRRVVVQPARTTEITVPPKPEDDEQEEAKEKHDKKKEGAEDDKRLPHLTQKGPIQEIKKQIRKLCPIGWEAGVLKIDAPSNYQEIDPIMDQVREKMGYGGGSSYGGDTFNFGFSGDKLVGRMAREKVDKKFMQVFEAKEVAKPYRELKVKKFSDGRIQITVNVQKSNYLLRIRQSTSGAFNVQELNGVEVFASNATNFDNFCRKHPDFTSDRLLPTLEHFGMGTIMTPYDARVQAKVTQLVSPWQEDDLKNVHELTEQLNAESYAEREAAAKELKKVLSENKDLLGRLVYDKRFTPEVRARTRSLIRSKLKGDKLAEMDFIENVAMSLDAGYLIELIRRAANPEIQTALVEKLKEIAPEFAGMADAGSVDVSSMLVSQAANAWASEQMAGPEMAKVDVSKDKGAMDDATAFTGQLVRLDWEKDQLKVDREHWEKPFAGKPIDELSKDVEKLVKESNLPKRWFNAGGASYARKSASHPQVLFEKMQEKLRNNDSEVVVNHHYNYNENSGSNTFDRSFKLGKIEGALSFSKQSRGGRSTSTASGSLAKKPFSLMLLEKKQALRRMTVSEPKIGELQIQVVGDRSNYIVQLTLGKDKALIQDIRGDYVQAFEGKSFRELQQAHPEYFRDAFFPLLRKLGIEISPEVDAGPDAAKTTDASKASGAKTATAGL